VPKALLPIGATPLIHRSVSEAVGVGIKKIVLVGSPGMEPVAEYFTAKRPLEKALESSGKTKLLETQRQIAGMADIRFIVQAEAKGLGHAVLMAREEIGDESFAVFLPDEVFWGRRSAIQQVVDTWSETGGNVFGAVRVPEAAVPLLGIVAGEPMPESTSTTWKVSGLVEKPRLEEAPSNLAIVGPYVLEPEVLDAVEHGAPGAVGELQLTDGIGEGQVFARVLEGSRIDTGNPAGMIAASIFESRRNPELNAQIQNVLDQADAG
jgi:UTP--glucose-1-phosphate uridylyltransferase